MKYPLTQQEIEQYRREGYVVVPSIFNAERLERVDHTIQEISTKAIGSGKYDTVLEIEPHSDGEKPVVRRIYNPFEQHETFRSLATDDRLLDRVECLVGESIQLQHSKLNMKAARVGSPVEWHQDLSYFPHTNADLVTVLVYLDDASKQNGCLQVIARMHDRYLPCHTPEGVFAGMLTEDVRSYGPQIPLEAPAGSAIFMHCLTPHSSLPNKSSRARRTLIFEYRAADAFPIYYGPRVENDEKHTFQVRGAPSRFARLAGPPPLIPVMPENFRSLYQLQEETKDKLGMAS
ncbi:MAG TPA: phytanoyl-CoA dioxygenase family protein [Terriglobia bacterium]|nr:phytanoyl-CoA dioxygenase family protein [Terriglobia bacterium]